MRLGNAGEGQVAAFFGRAIGRWALAALLAAGGAMLAPAGPARAADCAAERNRLDEEAAARLEAIREAWRAEAAALYERYRGKIEAELEALNASTKSRMKAADSRAEREAIRDDHHRERARINAQWSRYFEERKELTIRHRERYFGARRARYNAIWALRRSEDCAATLESSLAEFRDLQELQLLEQELRDSERRVDGLAETRERYLQQLDRFRAEMRRLHGESGFDAARSRFLEWYREQGPSLPGVDPREMSFEDWAGAGQDATKRLVESWRKGMELLFEETTVDDKWRLIENFRKLEKHINEVDELILHELGEQWDIRGKIHKLESDDPARTPTQ